MLFLYSRPFARIISINNSTCAFRRCSDKKNFPSDATTGGEPEKKREHEKRKPAEDKPIIKMGWWHKKAVTGTAPDKPGQVYESGNDPSQLKDPSKMSKAEKRRFGSALDSTRMPVGKGKNLPPLDDQKSNKSSEKKKSIDTFTPITFDTVGTSSVFTPEDAERFEIIRQENNKRPQTLFEKLVEQERIAFELWNPRNGWDEQIKLTKQGKMWTFPIDNFENWAQEVESESYQSHQSDLDELLDDLPKDSPIREFMQLIVDSLKRNPHVTASWKRKQIHEFKLFFQDKHEAVAKLVKQKKIEEAEKNAQ